MKRVIGLITLFFLGGCASNTVTQSKFPFYGLEQTAEEKVLPINNARITQQELNSRTSTVPAEAFHTGLSIVDYLHAVNSDKIKRVTPQALLPNPFTTFTLGKGDDTLEIRTIPVRYQAYDPNFPKVSPLFDTPEEAQAYATLNNGDGLVGHSYVVREVDFKYEVRHKNGSRDDQLHTTHSLAEARKYLEEYEINHVPAPLSDHLFIYELKPTGQVLYFWQELGGLNERPY